jgi:hypothetical protein
MRRVGVLEGISEDAYLAAFLQRPILRLITSSYFDMRRFKQCCNLLTYTRAFLKISPPFMITKKFL